MIGFLTRPAFTPPIAPIPLGTAGQTLTMVGGVPKFAGAGSGGLTFGTYTSSALVGAGPFNDLAPTGFGSAVGRLDLGNAGASCIVTGLSAGVDGQGVIIRNSDATNNLTLASANVGSGALNRFLISFDITLTPNSAVLAIYYTGLAIGARWVIKT